MIQPVPNRSARSRDLQGYSLIEIMVAMTILTGIVVGLLVTVQYVQRALRAASAQTDSLENGRAFLNLLNREMQEIVLFPEGASNVFRFLSTYRNGSPLLQSIPGVSDEKRTNHLQAFSFVVRSKDSTDWKAVFYDFQKSDVTRGVGALYRAEINYPRWSATNALAGKQRDFVTWAYNARDYSNPLTNGFGNFTKMLDGVIHLKWTAYDMNGLVISNMFSSFGSYQGYFFTNTAITNISFTPAALELELGILDSDLFRKLKSIGDPVAAQNFLEDRPGNVQIFRQRINIPTGP